MYKTRSFDICTKLDIDNVIVPLTYILIKTIHFLANVFNISFIVGIASDRQYHLMAFNLDKCKYGDMNHSKWKHCQIFQLF